MSLSKRPARTKRAARPALCWLLLVLAVLLCLAAGASAKPPLPPPPPPPPPGISGTAQPEMCREGYRYVRGKCRQLE